MVLFPLSAGMMTMQWSDFSVFMAAHSLGVRLHLGKLYVLFRDILVRSFATVERKMVASAGSSLYDWMYCSVARIYCSRGKSGSDGLNFGPSERTLISMLDRCLELRFRTASSLYWMGLVGWSGRWLQRVRSFEDKRLWLVW